MDMDSHVYMKHRMSTQDGQAVFFDTHKQFLDTNHVARQATEAKKKLQTSHYGGRRKGWDWDKYVALQKEQHAIMESLADHGCSGINNVTKPCQSLKGIKSIKPEAVVSIVWA